MSFLILVGKSKKNKRGEIHLAFCYKTFFFKKLKFFGFAAAAAGAAFHHDLVVGFLVHNPHVLVGVLPVLRGFVPVTEDAAVAAGGVLAVEMAVILI